MSVASRRRFIAGSLTAGSFTAGSLAAGSLWAGSFKVGLLKAGLLKAGQIGAGSASALIGASEGAAAADLRTVPGAISVDAEGLIALMLSDRPPRLIDTRLRGDFDEGHIDSAYNMPDHLMTADGLAALAARSQPVLFYCNGLSCPRSENASRMAISWGWEEVYWFPGGVAEWTANAFPLTRLTR